MASEAVQSSVYQRIPAIEARNTTLPTGPIRLSLIHTWPYFTISPAVCPNFIRSACDSAIELRRRYQCQCSRCTSIISKRRPDKKHTERDGLKKLRFLEFAYAWTPSVFDNHKDLFFDRIWTTPSSKPINYQVSDILSLHVEHLCNPLFQNLHDRLPHLEFTSSAVRSILTCRFGGPNRASERSFIHSLTSLINLDGTLLYFRIPMFESNHYTTQDESAFRWFPALHCRPTTNRMQDSGTTRDGTHSTIRSGREGWLLLNRRHNLTTRIVRR